MKNLFRLLLFIAAIFLIAVSCASEDLEPTPSTSRGIALKTSESIVLKNDNYVKDLNSRVYILGFQKGDEAAVTLGPVDGPFHITQVSFFLGTIATGAPAEKEIVLKIYRENNTTDPGTLIFSAPYKLTVNHLEIMQEIDLRNEDIYLAEGGSIRVSIMFMDDRTSIAREYIDTITPLKNWIKQAETTPVGRPGIWVATETKGYDKDFIIRATVKGGRPETIND